MKLGDIVRAEHHPQGKVTFICIHRGHESNPCVDVTLTNNTRYTLKYVMSNLEVINDKERLLPHGQDT